MSALDFFKDIKGTSLLLLSASVFLFTPGLLAVIIFAPQLIRELDALRLMLLSLVVIAPVFGPLYVAILFQYVKYPGPDGHFDTILLVAFLIGVVSANIVLYAALGIAWALQLSYTTTAFLALFFLAVCARLINERTKKAAKRSSLLETK